MIDREDNFVGFDILFMLKALWHRAWVLVLAMVIFAVAAFSASRFLIEPTYTATTVIYANNLIDRTNTEAQNSAISGGELSAAIHLAETYIVILKTPETLKEIGEKAGVAYSTKELDSMINATAGEDSEIFTVNVSSHDPQEAILLANVVDQVLPGRISSVVDGARVKTVQQAYSARQTAPDTMRMGLLGALIGLLIAAALVVISEMRDDKIYDEDYINTVAGDVPVLALIPDLRDTRAFAKNYYYGRGYGYTDDNKKVGHKGGKSENDKESHLSDLEKDKLIICENLDFTGSEAYKVLRTNLMYHLNSDSEGPKVIGVTSADRSEGKSTTSINLSYVFAQAGKRVMTIEGDLRLPTLAKRLDVEPGEGFTDLVSGTFNTTVIAPSGKFENWNVITAGSRTANPSEVLGNERVGTIMTVLKKKYDIIIVDLPPVNEVTDAMAIAPYLDGLVFVVKARGTKKVPFNMALHQLELAGAPLTGFVLANSTGGGGKYDKYGRYGKYGNKYYRSGKYYKNGYSYNGYYDGYGGGYGYGYGYRQPYGQPGQPYGYGEIPQGMPQQMPQQSVAQQPVEQPVGQPGQE